MKAGLLMSLESTGARAAKPDLRHLRITDDAVFATVGGVSVKTTLDPNDSVNRVRKTTTQSLDATGNVTALQQWDYGVPATGTATGVSTSRYPRTSSPSRSARSSAARLRAMDRSADMRPGSTSENAPSARLSRPEPRKSLAARSRRCDWRDLA